jgi:Protein of unknown function (DUF3040)
VPLSEHEQRILEEIEKNLYEEDPGFARGVRRASPRLQDSRRARVGLVTFIAGFAILIAFFVWPSLLVGVAAFGAMVGGIVLMAGSARGLLTSAKSGGGDINARIKTTMSEWEQRIRRRYRKT